MEELFWRSPFRLCSALFVLPGVRIAPAWVLDPQLAFRRRENHMKRYLVGCSAAAVLAFAVGVAAQEPTYPPKSPQTQASSAQSEPATIEGCLMREQDVPGRKPNVAERAGVMEDYILTNAKVVKGTAPKSSASATE